MTEADAWMQLPERIILNLSPKVEFDFSHIPAHMTKENALYRALCTQLSVLARFGGAADGYTVGQHSVLTLSVARRLYRNLYTRKHDFWLNVLIHDAHEICTSDIPNPTLYALSGDTIKEIKLLQDKLQHQIRLAFDIAVPEPSDVARIKHIDRIALNIERYWFFPSIKPWVVEKDIEAYNEWEKYVFSLYAHDYSPPMKDQFTKLLGEELARRQIDADNE